MFGFRAWKQIKKRLKRKRRPMWSLGMLAILFAGALAAGAYGAAAIERLVFRTVPAASEFVPEGAGAAAETPGKAALDSTSPARDAVLRALAARKSAVEVVLHRVYWCGEETRMLGSQAPDEAARLLKAHREWDVSLGADGRMVLEEHVDDPSPACRETAYIGMDEEGNLSLYDGPPRKDNVVRTFFQLDVKSLESSLPSGRLHELASGIRVSDKQEYDSVLSVFSDYASRKSKGVMRSVR